MDFPNPFSFAKISKWNRNPWFCAPSDLLLNTDNEKLKLIRAWRDQKLFKMFLPGRSKHANYFSLVVEFSSFGLVAPTRVVPQALDSPSQFYLLFPTLTRSRRPRNSGSTPPPTTHFRARDSALPYQQLAIFTGGKVNMRRRGKLGVGEGMGEGVETRKDSPVLCKTGPSRQKSKRCLCQLDRWPCLFENQTCRGSVRNGPSEESVVPCQALTWVRE